MSSNIVASVAVRDFDVFVDVLFKFCQIVCSFVFGFAFVDTSERVTGAMDTEQSRYVKVSEHCPTFILRA